MNVRFTSDLSSALWIKERLHPFARDVGSVIPEGFEAYARVFHPAHRGADLTRSVTVTWREIAAANGRAVHPEMQFGAIAGAWGKAYGSPSPHPELWSLEPETGSLPIELARTLVPLLRTFTSTPEACLFAVWEGWGDLPREATPRLEVPQRRYSIGEGPIDAATVGFAPNRFQSASMWWPADRAWFVSTEVDFCWTYVGGNSSCVDAMLRAPELEALPARVTDRFTWDSDTLNPPTNPPFLRPRPRSRWRALFHRD